MCQNIKHDKNKTCNAGSIYISGFGLACGKCDNLCACENKRQFEKERDTIEKDNKNNGYSYPTHQINALKIKYNQ